MPHTAPPSPSPPPRVLEHPANEPRRLPSIPAERSAGVPSGQPGSAVTVDPAQLTVASNGYHLMAGSNYPLNGQAPSQTFFGQSGDRGLNAPGVYQGGNVLGIYQGGNANTPGVYQLEGVNGVNVPGVYQVNASGGYQVGGGMNAPGGYQGGGMNAPGVYQGNGMPGIFPGGNVNGPGVYHGGHANAIYHNTAGQSHPPNLNFPDLPNLPAPPNPQGRPPSRG